MNLSSIGTIILDESSSPEALRRALSEFVQYCSELTGIAPNPSFDAWAGDSLLSSGVAINPHAAAHCASDYQRSTVFIRGIYAALMSLKPRYADTPLEILYAGCGPFATLLLPILGKFPAGELNVSLLDIHPKSVDSVELLLRHFGLDAHTVHTIRDDACHYKHNRKLHLIIAETMQKSLEQEPQFAVTANLAPQLAAAGVFIPQNITVSLELADLENEKQLLNQPQAAQAAGPATGTQRVPLATVCVVTAERVEHMINTASPGLYPGELVLEPVTVTMPASVTNSRLAAALFTRITVFENHRLGDYDSQITLPLKCPELAPLRTGQRYLVSYHLGQYPKFNFEKEAANRRGS